MVWYVVIKGLKGQLHEILEPRFFHQSTPPRALILGQRLFCIWPRIRRENRQYSNFSVAHDPAEISYLRFGSATFFKGNINQNNFIPIPYFYFKEKKLGNYSIYSRLHFHFDDFRSDYLGECLAIYETVLAC
jgi:hypothetical protein